MGLRVVQVLDAVLHLAQKDIGFAQGLRLACNADACELLDKLGAVRELVATEFDALLRDGQAPAANAKGGCKACGQGPLPLDSELLLEKLPAELAERVRPFAQGAKVQTMRDESKLRLGKLVLRAAQCVADEHCSMDASLRFVDWLEPLLRRESYLSLLVERPEVQKRLLRLLGLARWPMQFLMRHPGVIDEL